MDALTDPLAFLPLEPTRRSQRRTYGPNRSEDGFRCGRCGSRVSIAPQLSGVINRNHCPYCLWSKHLDLFQPGDRLSACKALMRPVGVAVKISRKRYGSDRGELMLAHLCLDCGKVSLNRIAADDDAQEILNVFEACLAQRGAPTGPGDLNKARLLGAADAPLVRTRLLGLDAPADERGREPFHPELQAEPAG